MKSKWYKTVGWSAAIVLLASCSAKNYIYIEDMPVDRALPITNTVETRIKTGDRLGISVICKNMELAAPFNSYTYRVAQTGEASGGQDGGNGYLVDKEGNINFPILGPLKVGGLTTDQVSEYVKNLLVEGKHIPDAVVETTITNFTIYGLGALSPGKLVVKDGHITLLQAIAQMGDLQARAKYNKVRVIREEDGQRMEFDVDLTTKNLYESPAYNLQQNDMVYAEPRKRNNEVFTKTLTGVSLLAAIASIGYSVAYILK